MQISNVRIFPNSLNSNKMPLYILSHSLLRCPLVLLTGDPAPLPAPHISLFARNPEESRFFFSHSHSSVPGPVIPPPAGGLANRLPISSVAGPANMSHLHSPSNGLSLGKELLAVTDPTTLITLSLSPFPILLSLSCHTIHPLLSRCSITGCTGAPRARTHTHSYARLTAHMDGQMHKCIHVK